MGNFRRKLSKSGCPEDLCIEMVTLSPTIERIQDRLFLEEQVCAEYHHITNQQLRDLFYSMLEQHTERLLAVSREKQGKTGRNGQKIAAILNLYSQQPRDVNTDRTVVLRCLPAILQEDDSGVFITCTEETSQDPAAIKRPAAIISVIDDD
ncbi:unnamed protein product, partial [Coregonus sp. 'balchen']